MVVERTCTPYIKSPSQTRWELHRELPLQGKVHCPPPQGKGCQSKCESDIHKVSSLRNNGTNEVRTTYIIIKKRPLYSTETSNQNTRGRYKGWIMEKYQIPQ
ncbi:hypothetical protein PCH_Pc22g18270 [Penicillium rubens Wisconsin 54-1255]|uniref:Uncharacterized protein n=1 Tax=Penicillium rubens (strain ATCC 28089 / DSM 1075 / NRRL 1951 / Wisconsin 54-1255) TaxID=500485 RepID=B6HU62_PENRW|nr:hypothetical protein PCH_Pc22g18270 [Penicillium rubens Wisconsin 54-1255]